MTKNERLSRSRLRSLAVIFSAHQLLHINEYKLVNKTETNEDKDIKVDVPIDVEIEIQEAIKYIDHIAVSILKSHKMHKKDEDFFIETTHSTLEAFFETGILVKGLSPHLAFVSMLFAFFIENISKKHESVFTALLDVKIYDEVLLKIEESDVLDWNGHYDSSIKSLKKSVGFSMAAHKKIKKTMWQVKATFDGKNYTSEYYAGSQEEAIDIFKNTYPQYQIRKVFVLSKNKQSAIERTLEKNTACA